jgi:hypothetical protein
VIGSINTDYYHPAEGGRAMARPYSKAFRRFDTARAEGILTLHTILIVIDKKVPELPCIGYYNSLWLLPRVPSLRAF